MALPRRAKSRSFAMIFPYDNGKDYVVTEGLEPGDVIIAEGAGLIKDGMQVKVKN